MVRSFMFIIAALFLTGCATTGIVDYRYDQIDTGYMAPLLPPPVVPQRDDLPEGSYYVNEQSLYVRNLGLYIEYLQRQKDRMEPVMDTKLAEEKVKAPPPPQCRLGPSIPHRPQIPAITKVKDIENDEEVILAMKYYILDLKKHIIDYDAAIIAAIEEHRRTCGP